MYTPKSLRSIRDDVLNVRLSAANTSLWSIAATVSARVDRAINDAILTYPFYIKASVTSIFYRPTNPFIPLPLNVEKVREVFAYHASDATTEIQVTEWRHTPTEWTNILRVEMPSWALETSIGKASPVFWVRVDYQRRQMELPTECTINIAGINDQPAMFPVIANPSLLPFNYAPTGLLEVRGTVTSLAEVAYYNSINPVSGFNVSVRGCLGTKAQKWADGGDTYVVTYPVLEAPHETYSVIVLESQANMFQYWLGHRAMYDQFATASQIAQLDVEEILTIVATLRKQAGERYLRLTAPEKYQPPKPGTYKTERRKDI